MMQFNSLRGPRLNHATIWLVVAPAFFCFGYNQAVAGGVLTLDSFVKTFPRLDTINTDGSERHNNSQVQGTVISMYTIGAAIGALSCIMLGDYMGRRKTIFLSSALAMLGAILMASSFSLGQIIVARIILGIGTGGYTAIIPVWQSEISRTKIRGAHVVVEGVFVGLGIACALWLDFGFFFIDPNTASWRVPFALQSLLPLIVLASIFYLPESPHWLLQKDRIEEAREILALLEDTPRDSETVGNGISEIKRTLAVSGDSSLADIFTMGPQRILQRVIIAVSVQVFMQMSGISLITFYTTTIFEQNLGFDPIKSRILSASMELCQPIGGAIAYFTIDGYGRRPLMLFSAASMMICMAVLAGTNSFPDNFKAMEAATSFLFIFNLVFPVGFLGLPFLYTAEIAPPNFRSPVSAIANAMNWLFNFLVTQVTPIGFNNIHSKYYIIYAIINCMMLPIIFFCFPETKGKSLEEIDNIFTESRSVFDPPRIASRRAHIAHHESYPDSKPEEIQIESTA